MHAPSFVYASVPLIETDQPTFVVGYYRSGTSLLHALLNRHPAIRLLYEPDVLEFWPVISKNRVQSDWEERLEFWNQTLSRHKISQPSTAPRPTNGREVALEVYRRYRKQTNAQIYGAKSACYHDDLLKLRETFPKAKFIVIWRSPTEILRSIRNAGKTNRFFNRKDFDKRVVAEIKQFARDCRKLKEMGVSVCEVQYSDIVANPQKPLEDICKYLGLGFDPCMLNLADADTSMLPEGEHHEAVRSGKIEKYSAKRSEILTPAELKLVSKQIENLPGAPWNKENAGEWSDSAWKWTISDRIQHYRTKTRELITHMIYAWVPLSILRKFRAWRAGSRSHAGVCGTLTHQPS